MPNELDQFLSDVSVDQSEDAFNPNPEQGAEEEARQPEEEPEEQPEFKPKNRRERRLQQKLEAERLSSIQLAEKLDAVLSAKGSNEEADYLQAIDRIYGTDSPEALAATEILKNALLGLKEDAKRAALEEIRSERQRESSAVAEAEEELESIIDDLEDTYGVELTDTQEQAYFALLQKMSPKDKNGEVISLADPHAVWEVFAEKMSTRKPDNRAKELSARSMTQSGATKDSTLTEDAGLRALRDMGIL